MQSFQQWLETELPQNFSAFPRITRYCISYCWGPSPYAAPSLIIRAIRSGELIGWKQAHIIIDPSLARVATCLAFSVTYWWPQCSPPLPRFLWHVCTRVLNKSETSPKKCFWSNYSIAPPDHPHTQKHTHTGRHSSQLKNLYYKVLNFLDISFLLLYIKRTEVKSVFQYETFSLRICLRDINTGTRNSLVKWWD